MNSIKATCVRGKGVHCKLDTGPALHFVLSFMNLAFPGKCKLNWTNEYISLSVQYLLIFYTKHRHLTLHPVQWNLDIFKIWIENNYNPLGLSSLATASLVPKYNHPSSWFFCVPIGWQNWKVLDSDWLTPVSCWLQVQTLLQKHKTNINMVNCE